MSYRALPASTPAPPFRVISVVPPLISTQGVFVASLLPMLAYGRAGSSQNRAHCYTYCKHSHINTKRKKNPAFRSPDCGQEAKMLIILCALHEILHTNASNLTYTHSSNHEYRTLFTDLHGLGSNHLLILDPYSNISSFFCKYLCTSPVHQAAGFRTLAVKPSEETVLLL